MESFSRNPFGGICRKNRISPSWPPRSSSLPSDLPAARRVMLRTPAPRHQRKPKRHRLTIWLRLTGPSNPAPMINRSLRPRGSSPAIVAPTMTTMTTLTTTIRTAATASLCFRPKSLHQSCRNTRSRNVPVMVIYGRPDIGAIPRRATTGFPARGPSRLKQATCGPPVIGAITVAGIATTTALGDSMSATTAALTMDSATAAPGIRAGTGAEIVSTTTAPSTM